MNKKKIFYFGSGFFLMLLILSFVFTGNKDKEEVTAKDNLIQEECTIREQKQFILDNMSYTESISYAGGLYYPEGLQEIDGQIDDMITDVRDCEGYNTYYHHVNPKEIICS